ncbi:TPA: phage tail protein [Pseudomonas aeruginosa]|nr:phage tail protein [Pseudomonas aeruginosa]
MMKYFKHKDSGEVFAFASDGSEDEFIGTDLLPMSVEDVARHLNPVPALPSESDLHTRIDAAADALRHRIAGDPLRAVEYAQAEAEAVAYAAAGYPSDAVPRTVAAWAVNGRTAQEAADSILTEAVIYREALYSIRERRLAAKENVRELMAKGAFEQALQVTNNFLEALKSDFSGYAA